MLNQIDFVTDQIRQLPGINQKPSGGVRGFASRIGSSLALGLKEKEIVLFGLLQWASMGLGYLLWVQMLDWIPDSLWERAADSDGMSMADLILLVWTFICVGIVAYPVGLLTGCMGATHFLHRQHRESTIATCLKLVLPQSGSLWLFHWIDGWITVSRILARLPREKDNRSAAQKALEEARFYAWKVGISGVLPAILTGNNLIRSGKASVIFVKDNFLEVARLRAGYSLLCWVIGIATYAGGVWFLMSTDLIADSDQATGDLYRIFLYAAIPLMLALGIIMLVLRPIYILALCDLYSDHLQKQGLPVELPDSPSRGLSALVAFACVCLIVAVAWVYRLELGLVEWLSGLGGQQP